MIKLTFAKFRSGRYNDKGECHELYILRDGDGDPLYIGKSVRGPWARWFDNWSSHFTKTVFGEYLANSPVARAVVANSPYSDKWIIELWTLEDCIDFLRSDIEALGFCLDHIDLTFAEGMMIRKLNPSENIMLHK